VGQTGISATIHSPQWRQDSRPLEFARSQQRGFHFLRFTFLSEDNPDCVLFPLHLHKSESIAFNLQVYF
jgi:hypothetical protein